MNEETAAVQPRNPSQQALYDLILWARDHPKEWFCACHPDSYGSDLEFFAKMIESLYRAGLYTVVLLVLYSNRPMPEVDWVLNKTVNECLLDIPMQRLIDRLMQNIRTVQRLPPSEI